MTIDLPNARMTIGNLTFLKTTPMVININDEEGPRPIDTNLHMKGEMVVTFTECEDLESLQT